MGQPAQPFYVGQTSYTGTSVTLTGLRWPRWHYRRLFWRLYWREVV